MSRGSGGAASPPSQAEELEALKRRREKRKLRRKGGKDVRTTLTSMIDIVFLLIFFFMVVTDLQSMEVEEIELPFAVEAKPDDDPEKRRVVVNVDRDGKVRIMGWRLGPDELFGYLQRAACEGPVDRDTGLPLLPVKIRADEATDYAKVRDVMVQCMRAKLWRVSFATRPPHEGGGLLARPEFR